MRTTDGTGQAGHYAPKHCIVQFGSSREPGIILGWRKTVHGQWQAQVLHTTGGGNVEVSVHLLWLPAAHVKPLER